MATSQPDATDAAAPSTKSIHSLILDTGPLIKNDPPASVLLDKAEKLFTLPSVIPEIRDPATRSRVETTLLPFVTIRSPKPESIKFIADFAKKTGDYSVLSRPDLEVLALGYELECERNGGDWRLRNVPGQKMMNGRMREEAAKASEEAVNAANANPAEPSTEANSEVPTEAHAQSEADKTSPDTSEQSLDKGVEQLNLDATHGEHDEKEQQETAETVEEPVILDGEKEDESVNQQERAENDEASDDEGEWITPSNVKKHQAQDAGSSTPSQPTQKTLQVAVLTSDYAMQNVALRMNLNLVTPSLTRISQLRNWVLRCHGCFKICKDMSRQFCPTCGQPTLNRVSCSTDEHGNFKVHLKKNFQWNNRGNVYSVPKPVHGSAHGRLPKDAAGKNNWGANLIFAEDQKEYVKASQEQQRTKKKDLMDDDFLPGILTGDRSGSGGKIRVGAGKRVNSRRKH